MEDRIEYTPVRQDIEIPKDLSEILDNYRDEIEQYSSSLTSAEDMAFLLPLDKNQREIFLLLAQNKEEGVGEIIHKARTATLHEMQVNLVNQARLGDSAAINTLNQQLLNKKFDETR